MLISPAGESLAHRFLLTVPQIKGSHKLPSVALLLELKAASNILRAYSALKKNKKKKVLSQNFDTGTAEVILEQATPHLLTSWRLIGNSLKTSLECLQLFLEWHG
ncbi:hypothetical protein KIL84_016269 [Mauremys mutica]|uniref:Uncharacterized protein n=1 Tax=Mauremys mutica TaxID=74926 RepID=A0A9D4AMI8_9SAUR|nr:hypothetical protein KIL84_016269 [Mauremys mutica]